MGGTNFTRQIHPVLRFMISIIMPLLLRFGLRVNVQTPVVSGARLSDVAVTGGVSMTNDGVQLHYPEFLTLVHCMFHEDDVSSAVCMLLTEVSLCSHCI